MAKWGTYPPDEQLRLKRAAAEEMYEALEDALAELRRIAVEHRICNPDAEIAAQNALAKARGEAA